MDVVYSRDNDTYTSLGTKKRAEIARRIRSNRRSFRLVNNALLLVKYVGAHSICLMRMKGLFTEQRRRELCKRYDKSVTAASLISVAFGYVC